MHIMTFCPTAVGCTIVFLLCYCININSLLLIFLLICYIFYTHEIECESSTFSKSSSHLFPAMWRCRFMFMGQSLSWLSTIFTQMVSTDWTYHIECRLVLLLLELAFLLLLNTRFIGGWGISIFCLWLLPTLKFLTASVIQTVLSENEDVIAHVVWRWFVVEECVVDLDM